MRLKQVIYISFLSAACIKTFSQNRVIKIIPGSGGVITVDTTSLSNRINLKQNQLSGTGYVKFSGTTASYLTPTQVTADLNLFTSGLQGLVPLSGGGTSNFLRADGTWATPPGSSGWSTSGNTGTAYPDSSVVLGTTNATSLRLQTNGRNALIIDSIGLSHFTDTSRNQIEMHRKGQYGTSGKFLMGDVGEAYVTQNPGDNFKIYRSTGVGQIMRNLNFDEYTGNPSISEYLEHDGSGVEIEVGQDGISMWTANYSTAGSHNLKLVSQNGVNGNFGISVQIPKYKFHLFDPVYPTTAAIQYNQTSGNYGQIVWMDAAPGSTDPSVNRSLERWRISNISPTNVTIPNFFGIEQGKNIAGTLINQYRLVINDAGSVGIGSQAPASSAKLDIESTTQGVLLPRMTKAQRDAIGSPATGLMIYQTDNTPGLRVWNATNWIRYTETAD